APAASDGPIEMPPPQAAVVAGQEAAGNRAMTSLLAGGARPGIQRAPDDDPRRNSGMAHGPTLDSSGGVATAPTLPGTRPADPRARGWRRADGPGGDATQGAAHHRACSEHRHGRCRRRTCPAAGATTGTCSRAD